MLGVNTIGRILYGRTNSDRFIHIFTIPASISDWRSR